MVIKEIEFPEGEVNPAFVVRALEALGFENKAQLKGPSKVSGKIVGCFVRFNDEADADKFVAAWKGFLELKKGGRLPDAFMPSFTPSFASLAPVFTPILPDLPKKPE